MRKRVKVIAKYIKWQKLLGRVETAVHRTYEFKYKSPRVEIFAVGKDTQNPFYKKDINYSIYIDERMLNRMNWYSRKLECHCLKNDEFRYLIRCFEKPCKNFELFVVKNKKNKRNYIGRMPIGLEMDMAEYKYRRKEILESVCRKFNWKKKDCKIRNINIFDYTVRFFCKKVRNKDVYKL